MSIESRLHELQKDLCNPAGPSISTNRNYPFAILWYPPGDEYEARERIVHLGDDLRRSGWLVISIDLMGLLLEYLYEIGEGALVDSIIEEEKMLYREHRGSFKPQLSYLENQLGPHFSGKQAFPGRVLREILERTTDSDARRSVVFLSRIGGLYPFYRTSALLRFLDEGVRVPTIVMYPGIYRDQHSLSFMGEMDADRDYRPRIY